MEQKEQAEFTELLQKYSSMVLRIAFSNVKNLQDAQDIAQEVLSACLQSVRSLTAKSTKKRG